LEWEACDRLDDLEEEGRFIGWIIRLSMVVSFFSRSLSSFLFTLKSAIFPLSADGVAVLNNFVVILFDYTVG